MSLLVFILVATMGVIACAVTTDVVWFDFVAARRLAKQSQYVGSHRRIR